MATFTTELGSYIESFTDYRLINITTEEKIEKGMPYLFSFPYSFYSDDENIRLDFQKQFIRHFYKHEIGVETVGLFKMRLQDKLNMIMPRYKDLYDNYILLKEKIFENTNLTNIEKEDSLSNKKGSENGTATVSSETNTENNAQNIQSDNPQTNYAQSDFASGMYRGKEVGRTDSNLNSTNENNTSNVDKFDRTEAKITTGWNGSKNEEFEKFRNNIFSINEKIFSECETLFMQVYNSYTNKFNDFNMLGFGEYGMFRDSIDWMR